MNSRLKIFLAFLAIGFLGSCVNDKANEIVPNTLVDCDTTYYKTTIRPIIIANCAIQGCHVTGGQSPHLNSYTTIYGGRNDIKFKINLPSNNSNIMPPSGPLSAADLTKINNWIDSGAAGCD
ncbi:MAG: hypothetical protein IPP29_04665 [Bacteroidetes bacterium]|nr:hypothetical protein [Bacteroidota bacterium]